jgi:hypothetical protein
MLQLISVVNDEEKKFYDFDVRWINGMLLPEIYVHRGKTYYFRVQVWLNQGILTEGEGSVQLTSLLRWVVL